MLNVGAKAEGARARRRRLSRTQGKKMALMGGIAATALAVGLTPTLANAASSQTYFVGFPDWLPIGESATLPADGEAIKTAILAAKDKAPLIGWGTGGVALEPRWVKWYTPIADQEFTPPKYVGTGTYTEHPVPNDAYTAVYNPAYDKARADAVAADRNKLLNSSKLKDILSPSAWSSLPSWVRNLNPGNPLKGQTSVVDGVIAAAGRYDIKVLGQTIYTLDLGSSVADWDAKAKAAAEAAVKAEEVRTGQTIPATVIRYDEVYKWTDPFWTTTTSGQWVSPTDDVKQVTDLSDLGSLLNVPVRDITYYASGDRGFLAPYLNWTTYLSNVNLIAYGDGAIAAGEAYRQILESIEDGTYPVGEARTGPRRITIIRVPGDDGVLHQNNVDYVLLPPTSGFDYPDAGDPPSYDVVQAGGVLDLTVLSLVLVRNPGRANGGLYARFAPIYEELTGVNPVSPERQDVLPEGVDPELIAKLLNGDTDGIDMQQINDLGEILAVVEDADGKPMLVTIKADVGWQYDLMSDAPATANPIAWANSLASSVFLTNLLTGTDFNNLGDGFKVGPDGTLYYTAPVEELPLLAPLRMPSQLLGLAQGDLDPNSPLADALEPMLRILVNSAYTDVKRNADGTWTRSLDEFGTPTLFGTETLTRAEQALMVGDLIAALGKGIGDEMSEALVDLRKAVTEQLRVDVPAEQSAAIDDALRAPGTAISTASRDLGTGVSQALSSVEQQLPERPTVTQEQLASGQQQVGEQLADSRDRAEETVERVDSAVEEVGDGVRTRAEERAERRQALKSGIDGAVKKTRDDVKKTVDKVRSDLKKAGEKLRPKSRASDSNADSSSNDANDANDSNDSAK